eukprot:12911986-Prorocentrum_lima.AAC.1
MASRPPTRDDSYMEGLLQLAAGCKLTAHPEASYEAGYQQVQHLAQHAPADLEKMMASASYKFCHPA